MTIGSVMKERVVSVSADQTLESAMRLLVDERVGLLPVVDAQHRLLGVLGLEQVLELALPAFVGMLEDYDFVADFGAVELARIDPAVRRRPVRNLMREAISVQADCGLLRAHAVMRQHGLRDLPVIDREGRLVGIASWVDVGTAFLRSSLAEGGA